MCCQHVAMAHKDLGIERVRFHGILDDDMSVSFGECGFVTFDTATMPHVFLPHFTLHITLQAPNETGFVNIDSTCDFLIRNNMSMIMELGFMPRWLARNKTGTEPKGGDGPYSCRHTINHVCIETICTC